MPAEIIDSFCAFLDFCYLIRQDSINDNTLLQIQECLEHFYHCCAIFEVLGVCPNGFTLPRQHSPAHYPHLIHMFSVPNSLCSSITESKHIPSTKKPYHQSNHCNALEQILLTNQQLDKLAAACVNFKSRGMLRGMVLVDACACAGSPGK